MEKVIFEDFQGVVPPGYVPVSRWCNASEARLWRQTHKRIPSEISNSQQVYVTAPGAPKPGGTGDHRVDFYVPKQMLLKASNPQWWQIAKISAANTPIYNVRILLVH